MFGVPMERPCSIQRSKGTSVQGLWRSVRGCSVGRAKRLDELAAPKPADRYLHRRVEAERSELAECTFAPKILHRPTSAPHHQHAAPGTMLPQSYPHPSFKLAVEWLVAASRMSVAGHQTCMRESQRVPAASNLRTLASLKIAPPGSEFGVRNVWNSRSDFEYDPTKDSPKWFDI
jgi:hypothetical protein